MQKRVFAHKLQKPVCSCLLIRQLHTATSLRHMQPTVIYQLVC